MLCAASLNETADDSLISSSSRSFKVSAETLTKCALDKTRGRTNGYVTDSTVLTVMWGPQTERQPQQNLELHSPESAASSVLRRSCQIIQRQHRTVYTSTRMTADCETWQKLCSRELAMDWKKRESHDNELTFEVEQSVAPAVVRALQKTTEKVCRRGTPSNLESARPCRLPTLTIQNSQQRRRATRCSLLAFHSDGDLGQTLEPLGTANCGMKSSAI
jgi:hypothetical protein